MHSSPCHSWNDLRWYFQWFLWSFQCKIVKGLKFILSYLLSFALKKDSFDTFSKIIRNLNSFYCSTALLLTWTEWIGLIPISAPHQGIHRVSYHGMMIAFITWHAWLKDSIRLAHVNYKFFEPRCHAAEITGFFIPLSAKGKFWWKYSS